MPKVSAERAADMNNLARTKANVTNGTKAWPGVESKNASRKDRGAIMEARMQGANADAPLPVSLADQVAQVGSTIQTANAFDWALGSLPTVCWQDFGSANSSLDTSQGAKNDPWIMRHPDWIASWAISSYQQSAALPDTALSLSVSSLNPINDQGHQGPDWRYETLESESQRWRKPTQPDITVLPEAGINPLYALLPVASTYWSHNAESLSDEVDRFGSAADKEQLRRPLNATTKVDTVRSDTTLQCPTPLETSQPRRKRKDHSSTQSPSRRLWLRAANGQFASAKSLSSGDLTCNTQGSDANTTMQGPRIIRKRRRSHEINRRYRCDYQDCCKAYGTLNHLNTHRAKNEHGDRLNAAAYRRMQSERQRMVTM